MPVQSAKCKVFLTVNYLQSFFNGFAVCKYFTPHFFVSTSHFHTPCSAVALHPSCSGAVAKVPCRAWWWRPQSRRPRCEKWSSPWRCGGNPRGRLLSPSWCIFGNLKMAPGTSSEWQLLEHPGNVCQQHHCGCEGHQIEFHRQFLQLSLYEDIRCAPFFGVNYAICRPDLRELLDDMIWPPHEVLASLEL